MYLVFVLYVLWMYVSVHMIALTIVNVIDPPLQKSVHMFEVHLMLAYIESSNGVLAEFDSNLLKFYYYRLPFCVLSCSKWFTYKIYLNLCASH